MLLSKGENADGALHRVSVGSNKRGRSLTRIDSGEWSLPKCAADACLHDAGLGG
jgi:hypothetical protein